MKNRRAQPGQESFYHQPTPPRVAARLGGQQKNRGTRNVRKPKRA